MNVTKIGVNSNKATYSQKKQCQIRSVARPKYGFCPHYAILDDPFPAIIDYPFPAILDDPFPAILDDPFPAILDDDNNNKNNNVYLIKRPY